MKNLSNTQKNELKELEKIQKIFTNFLESTSDFIYIKDTKHKFLYTSNSFAKLAGYNSWKELIGKSDFDIFPKEHAEIYFEQEKDVILTGKKITNFVEPYFKDGKLCYVSSSKRAIYDEEGNITGLYGISRDISDRIELEKKLREYADFDSLTGLYNRRMFFENSRKLLEICKRECKEASIYFIDLDGFKAINDTLGHEAGDKVLSTIAKRLKDGFRTSDILCRFGGDEFIIFAISNDDKTTQNIIKDHILQSVSRDIIFKDKTLNINCSIGISSFPGDAHTIENLICIADEEMYKNKNKKNKEF